METIGDRIKALRVARDMTRGELATRLGMPYPTLAGIENGSQSASTKLHRIATELRTTPEYLETGKGPRDLVGLAADGKVGVGAVAELRRIVAWSDPSELPPDQYLMLPRLEYHLSAGNGGPDPNAAELLEAGAAFRADYCAAEGWSAKTHFAYRAQGESMEPTIQSSAPVVIDTSVLGRLIHSGKIYAIVIDGDPLLKRLDRLPGQRIRVRSDNPSPEYSAFDVYESEIKVIGRAVWTAVRL